MSLCIYIIVFYGLEIVFKNNAMFLKVNIFLNSFGMIFEN